MASRRRRPRTLVSSKTITKLKAENRQLHTKLATVERLRKLQEATFARPALTDIAWRRIKGIQEPEYNPIRLWAYYELDDTLQGVVQKIATEVTRAKGEPPESWRIVPNFAKRCSNCETEYAGEVDECEACGNVAFMDPDPAGKKMLEDFFRNLNADVSTDTILEDTCIFSLVLDNWYWWVRSEPNVFGVRIPNRIDVLDSRFIRAMTDEMGRFGTNEWFCPTCYWTSKEADQNRVRKGEEWAEKPCPFGCGGTLQETAWVQRGRDGKIVGRWTEQEIVHGKRFGGSYRLYGLSPIVSLITMIEALLYQGRYLISAYRDRRVWDGVLSLPLQRAEGEQMLKESRDAWAQKPSEFEPLILFTGSEAGTPAGDAKWVTMMGKFADLLPVEFRKEHKKAIMARYGVGEVLQGAQTPGQLGHPADSLEASFDSIEGLQTHESDVVNRGVVSRFPPAASKDWHFEFVSPKQRDEKLDWEVRQIKITVAKAINDAGMDKHAEIDSEWNVEILEGPPPKPNPLMPGMPPIPGMPTIPGSESPPSNIPEPPTPHTEAPILSQRSKELSPRRIPPSAAVPGVRGVEDAYSEAIVDRYRTAIDRAVSDAEGSIQAIVWEEALNRRLAEAKVDALTLTETMAAQAYVAALEEEARVIPSARFEQLDEGVLERIASPEAFTTYLEGFDAEARNAIVAVITDRFSRPAGLDLKAMVAEMRDATDAAAFRLERIARSETTRIVNEARAAQWRKYADPAIPEYEWITATDERVDEKCAELRSQNPWALEDLRVASRDFLPHPNCRCTVVRRPSLSLGR